MDLPAILGALESGGFDGWYDMEVFSSETYPDSLLRLPPEELVRRGREGFLRAWEARRPANALRRA
jgi:sugar phosphate isomerase/epimerase